MNEKLKFSWGHIIAFLGLIFICYTTFVGVCYLTDGSFLWAGIGTLVVFLVCIFVFIGAQQLKAIDHKFDRNIIIERILVWTSPIIFLAMVFPMCHAWTVYHRSDKIVSNFESAINSSKQLFNEYDKYADNRIANYEKALTDIVANKETKPEEYKKCLFSGNNDAEEIKTRVKVLDYQIRTESYAKLKEEASAWIDRAGSGASTWNVFLMGNIKEVKNAMGYWHEALTNFTKQTLPGEDHNGNKIQPFDPENSVVPRVCKQLDSLSKDYTAISAPSIPAIICAILCYLFLIFPWVIQDRHSKSVYRFIGREKAVGGGFAPSPAQRRPNNPQKQRVPQQPRRVQGQQVPPRGPQAPTGRPTKNGGKSDYDMFTIN